MKKNYIVLKIEIIGIASEDVITASSLELPVQPFSE